MHNSRWVYSTGQGRICPDCGNPGRKCGCRRQKKDLSAKRAADGILRIGREVKGRKGKGVTTISGFDLDESELKNLAGRLKRLCGCGGSVKSGVIIIQGDHRKVLAAELAQQGYRVKLTGG